MKPKAKDFSDLKNFLKGNGYKVTTIKRDRRNTRWNDNPYRYYEVTGKGIYAGFCTSHEHGHKYIRNSFAADNEACFDKWTKCPLVVKLPLTKEDKQILLRLLKHLGSKEGYELSNSYGYLDNNPYFYEVN